MPGSPGGLMRIDRIFGGSGYTNAFGSAPLIFGAFPSLHSGNATMQALTLSHFFPRFKVYYWAYVGVLYWATMYLTHHYLIDVVGGGCLAMGCFYYFMPKSLRNINSGINWESTTTKDTARLHQGMQYEVVDGDGEYDIDDEIRKLEGNGNAVASSDTPYEEGSGKGRRKVSWGASEVMGGEGRSRGGENGHT
jgi:inositol phosphorylceramide synthase catalytic subunit